VILTVLVLAGDAHHVAVVIGHEIGGLVDERLTHPRSVLLIDAPQESLYLWVKFTGQLITLFFLGRLNMCDQADASRQRFVLLIADDELCQHSQ
jgi:hypothetical protein